MFPAAAVFSALKAEDVQGEGNRGNGLRCCMRYEIRKHLQRIQNFSQKAKNFLEENLRRSLELCICMSVFKNWSTRTKKLKVEINDFKMYSYEETFKCFS